MSSKTSVPPRGGDAEISHKHFLVTQPYDFVTHVQINRPSKLNSFHEAMWHELEQIFNRLSTAPHVRAVILSGVGDRAFTTGIDVQAAAQGDILGQSASVTALASSTASTTSSKTNTSASPSSGEEKKGSRKNLDMARQAVMIRRHVAEFQRCISSVEKCEKPVICVLHGFTYGLGIDICACADIRLCSADTQFSVKEVDIGLAADIGTLTRLPKIVGSFSWVKDVALSARVFGAQEAYRVGFVSQVFSSKALALEEAFRMGVRLATKSPIAVQGTKELLNHAKDHSISDSLRYTGIWNSAALQTEDVRQALLSGIQKTSPRFEKL